MDRRLHPSDRKLDRDAEANRARRTSVRLWTGWFGVRNAEPPGWSTSIPMNAWKVLAKGRSELALVVLAGVLLGIGIGRPVLSLSQSSSPATLADSTPADGAAPTSSPGTSAGASPPAAGTPSAPATALIPPAPPVRTVGPVPGEIRERFGLADFYQKCVLADGFPIVSSERVSDYALLEAAYLIDCMLTGRDDIRKRLIENKVRFVVMATSELTTQIPEHSDLSPSKYWDRRARGLGATRERPAVSCGEENLLGFPGDPYRDENILVHEFAHAIHALGLPEEFDARLRAVYERAMAQGLWRGKYASTNHHEYWAEAVQSWFGTNRPPDHDHNHVDTRPELIEYDPAVADLVRETFPADWEYVAPSQRKEPRHLAQFVLRHEDRFEWPRDLDRWYREYYAKAQATRRDPGKTEAAAAETPDMRRPNDEDTAPSACGPSGQDG